MSHVESSNAILKLDGISKSFGGLMALNNVSFSTELGKITALVWCGQDHRV